MTKHSCLVFCVALLAFACGSRGICQNSMLMPPYLQAVSPTGVDVLVESSTTAPVTVFFGLISRYTDSSSTTNVAMTDASTLVHDIRLSGLRPNSLYHYRARQGNAVSADATFRTAVEAGTPFRFGWEADMRTGIGVHDSIDAHLAPFHPSVLLIGGDIARTSSYESFKTDFFRPLQFALISTIPFFNATGNHEGWATNARAFTRAPKSASGSEAFYSFDYGDMHVLVLNTQLPYEAGSPQYAFAAKDLATTSRAWKVVIAHMHAYCAGGHGEDPGLIAMTSGVFEPNKVDLFIAGHSHFYQHNIVNAIHHLIIGSAGAPLYQPESNWYTVKSAREYNFAIGDVSPTTFRLFVYNEHGAVLDSLVLEKPALPAGDKQ